MYKFRLSIDYNALTKAEQRKVNKLDSEYKELKAAYKDAVQRRKDFMQSDMFQSFTLMQKEYIATSLKYIKELKAAAENAKNNYKTYWKSLYEKYNNN